VRPAHLIASNSGCDRTMSVPSPAAAAAPRTVVEQETPIAVQVLRASPADGAGKSVPVGPVGIEPTTRGLKVRCSAD
jgi:hypothetical protein